MLVQVTSHCMAKRLKDGNLVFRESSKGRAPLLTASSLFFSCPSSNSCLFRYMMLDESTRCLRIYTNEREDRLVCEIDPQTVCNCYQPENPEERSQHIFLVR